MQHLVYPHVTISYLTYLINQNCKTVHIGNKAVDHVKWKIECLLRKLGKEPPEYYGGYELERVDDDVFHEPIGKKLKLKNQNGGRCVSVGSHLLRIKLLITSRTKVVSKVSHSALCFYMTML